MLTTTQAFDLARSRGYRNSKAQFRREDADLGRFELRKLGEKERERLGKLKSNTTPSYEDIQE